MTLQLRAVLFDMDGVLIDSEPTSSVAMQRACARFGFSVPESDMDDFLGLPGDVTYSMVASRYADGRTDAVTLRAARDEIYEGLLGTIPPVAGALDVVSRYVEAGLRLGLTTSSRRAHADSTLARLGLKAIFDVVIGSEDVTRAKPDPAPYLATVTALGLAARECAVIEDSTNGIRSAVGAGCMAIGLTTSFSETALLDAGAFRVCATHEEIAALLLPPVLLG